MKFNCTIKSHKVFLSSDASVASIWKIGIYGIHKLNQNDDELSTEQCYVIFCMCLLVGVDGFN